MSDVIEDEGVDELEKAYAQAPYTGSDAGDNQTKDHVAELKDKVAAKGVDTATGGAGGRVTQIVGSVGSYASGNKKKLIAGGGGLIAILIPVILIIGFLSLFKLNDIEKLYIDRQFLKVNAALGERARELVKEAQAGGEDPATGSDTTEVTPSDPVETQVADLNADQINAEASNPNVESDAISRLEDSNLSTAGVGGELDTEFDIERDEPKIDDTGKTEEQLESEVKESDRAAVQANEDPGGGSLPDNSADIEEKIKSGEDPAVAMAEEGPNIDLLKGAAKFSTIDAIVTYYCIGEDIYGQTFGKLSQTRTTELARLAARTFTAADAQKLGKLSLGQIGAYNDLFDSNGESFTQSASYHRATNQPVDTDSSSPNYNPDLDPAAMPFGLNAGTIFNTIATIFDPPVVHSAVSAFCGFALQPASQASAAIVEYALQVASDVIDDGGSTAADTSLFAAIRASMWGVFKDVLTTKSAGKAAVTLGATEVLQLMGAQSAANYAGATTTGTENPISRANKVDAGTDIMANESARLMGGRQLTDSENAQLVDAQSNYEASQTSIASRIFNLHNPQSVGAMALAAIPTDPKDIINNIGHYLASVFNPSYWATKVLAGGKATADTSTGADPYGIPQYGFTQAELSQYDIVDNAKYVEANPSIFQAYAGCFHGGTNAFVSAAQAGSSDVCDNANDPNLTRYRLYILDKQVIADFANIYNKTPDTSSGGSSSTTACQTGSSCNVFLLGDSISVRAQGASPSIGAVFSAAGFNITVDGSVGRSITGAGQSPTTSGLDAVASDKTAISAAQVIIIELGTNYGDDPNTMSQLLGAIKAINPNAKLYWVNVGSMGYSSSRPGSFASYNSENALINQMASTGGYTVINWCNQVFGGGNNCTITGSPLNPGLLDPADGVHPSEPTGINTFIQTIMSSLQGQAS